MFGNKKKFQDLQNQVDLLKEKTRRLEHIIDFLSARDVGKNRTDIQEIGQALEKEKNLYDDPAIITDANFEKLVHVLATKEDTLRIENKLNQHSDLFDGIKSFISVLNKPQL